MTPAKITPAKHSITKTHLGIFQMWVFDFGVFENIVNIKDKMPAPTAGPINSISKNDITK